MKRKPFFIFVCLAIILPINAYSSNVINSKNGVLDADGMTVWYDATLLGFNGKGWTNTISGYDRLPFVKRLRKSHPTTPVLLVEDSNFNDLGMMRQADVYIKCLKPILKT